MKAIVLLVSLFPLVVQSSSLLVSDEIGRIVVHMVGCDGRIYVSKDNGDFTLDAEQLPGGVKAKDLVYHETKGGFTSKVVYAVGEDGKLYYRTSVHRKFQLVTAQLPQNAQAQCKGPEMAKPRISAGGTEGDR